MKKLLGIIILYMCVFCMSTEIEDHLETEIDLRPPYFFRNRSSQLLSVRIAGFTEITNNDPYGNPVYTGHISNWEIFAHNYWYETRVVNSTCPQLPEGIATYADWALMVPCMFGNPNVPPRIVYVHNFMLSHFVESTLNFMDHSYKFVLVTSGTDATVPKSSGDTRYKGMRGFGGSDGGPYWNNLVNNPHIIHWFAENHDMNHPKVSTLPTGMSVDKPDDRTDFPTNITRLDQRPLKAFMSDRVRAGSQWADRWNAHIMCQENSHICAFPDENEANSSPLGGMTHKRFLEQLVTYPFVTCVHGGGIDPSPKAWEAILVGTIPIIKHSTLDDAYEKLPVAFVNEWTDFFLHPNPEELMKGWIQKLQPYYEEGSSLRKKVLHRLTMAYWVEQFDQKLEEYEVAELARLHSSDAPNATTTAPHRLRRRKI